jgi:putative transposase
MEQLASLTEDARAIALERFRLLQPHLEDKLPLAPLAAEAGIPFRTAQRWVALYHQFGLSALCGLKSETHKVWGLILEKTSLGSSIMGDMKRIHPLGTESQITCRL